MTRLESASPYTLFPNAYPGANGKKASMWLSMADSPDSPGIHYGFLTGSCIGLLYSSESAHFLLLFFVIVASLFLGFEWFYDALPQSDALGLIHRFIPMAASI